MHGFVQMVYPLNLLQSQFNSVIKLARIVFFFSSFNFHWPQFSLSFSTSAALKIVLRIGIKLFSQKVQIILDLAGFKFYL